MSKPFVLFDCWDTVITYRVSDPQWVACKLLENCDNPEGHSPQKIISFLHELMNEYYVNMHDFDVSILTLFNYACLTLGLKPRLPLPVLEQRVLLGEYAPEPMPFLAEVFKCLDSQNIGFAVASNTVYSAKETEDHVRGCFPDVNLAFVLASSEVAVKKPNPRFFNLAAKVAGTLPQDCIYVGDNFFADVYGSRRANFRNTIWFNRRNELPPFERHPQMPTDLKYDEVKSHQETLAILKRELTA